MSKRMKVTILATLIFFSLSYVLLALWRFNRPLDKAFVEKAVILQTDEIVTALNSRDFEKVKNLSDKNFSREFQGIEKQLEEEYLEPAGTIEDIEIKKISGYYDRTRKREYAQVTVRGYGTKKDLNYRLFLSRSEDGHDYPLVHLIVK